MIKLDKKHLLVLLIFLVNCSYQQSDDLVFREYYWYNQNGGAGEALRIGGKLDEGSTQSVILDSLDLVDATKVEVIIEKILCHGDTKGLVISFNNNDWIKVPEADSIPYPQWEYQHHFFPTIILPVSYLNEGKNNFFKMKVDTAHSWNWPQNLINGVHLRVYYTPNKKDYSRGMIKPIKDKLITANSNISTLVENNHENVSRIEYLGHYEGINWEGDGKYTQWHYTFDHGKIKNHIGTALEAPYSINWDTEWIPDQKNDIKIKARIIDKSGMIYETKPLENLKIARNDYSVELYKPYDVSKHWATRNETTGEKVNINGNLNKAVDAVICWNSWSPCYMNGIFINDEKVLESEGPCYESYQHWVKIKDLSVLQVGENVITTGRKQKNKKGEFIHGMEVNYPGIMLLIKYEN